MTPPDPVSPPPAVAPVPVVPLVLSVPVVPVVPTASRVTTRIDDHPVADHHRFGSPRHGAELCFRGVVRGTEAGQPIRGIRYTAYLPMARTTLQTLAENFAAAHPDAMIHIHHTLGEVAAGEASLLLAVATPHSAESLTLLANLLRRLKAEVPIWKLPLPIDAPLPVIP